MIAIIMFGVGFVSGMYVSTQIENSIDNNIKNKKDDQLNNYLYICRMKYINIKRILRIHIEKGLQTLWTHDEKGREFTCIYKNYSDDLQIYTPQQLIDKLENEITISLSI